MQPAKRGNSGDPVLCGAPAGKVAGPPVSHDDPNQSSLLKAFEAIVAAGRRGLLGPTARAAADAMPDADLGGSDGKAGVVMERPSPDTVTETPSPGPLVELKEGEKKGKEEEGKEGQKTEKKERKRRFFTVVMYTPPVVGTGISEPCSKEIWIIGDSVIMLLSWRAQENNLQIQLDLPSCITSISWRGYRQMLWNDLLPVLHNIHYKRPFPSVIIIHLGGGDLWRDSSDLLLTKMQNDLGVLQRAWPGVILIWSSLLPKVPKAPNVPKVLYTKSQDLESKRSHINGKMEEYCTENGICYLSHPLFTVENKALFLPDNTLSNEGADIFVTDLKEILQTNLRLKTC